jgi:putative phosphoribosyl transferase
MVDLLDGEERADPHIHSDSNLLTERWITIARWLRHSSTYGGWNVGLYARGIPAAGALMAAARQPDDVQAVVTHNGRADLAENWLPLVEAPTLMLVDSGEEDLLEVNLRAVGHLETIWEMVEVGNGAGEHPGRVAGPANRLTRTWFLKNLCTRSFM